LSSGVVLIDLREGGGKWPLDHEEEEPEEGDAMEQDGEQAERRTKKGYVIGQHSEALSRSIELTFVRSTLMSAIWSPCGSRIYAGTNQGEVIIFDPLTKQVSTVFSGDSINAHDTCAGHTQTKNHQRIHTADIIRLSRPVGSFL
jgi:hypothetical protein